MVERIYLCRGFDGKLGEIVGLFPKKRLKAQAVVTRGMSLETVTDTGGYEFGVIWQPEQHQGSVVLFGDESFSPEVVHQWRQSVCAMDQVLVVMVVWSADAVPRVVVTFDAAGKKRDDFLTWLAVRLLDFYSPSELDVMWWPQTAENITAYASSLWAPASPPVFPPFAEDLEEHHNWIGCDQTYRVAFDVLLSGVWGEEIATEIEGLVLSSSLESSEQAHFVELARPIEPVILEDNPGVQPFRRTGVILLSADNAEQCEDFISDLVASLSARARVRITRLFGRQHLGVLLAGGVPVYGWQHSDGFVR